MDSKLWRYLLWALVLLAAVIGSLFMAQRSAASFLGDAFSDLTWPITPPSTSGDHAATSLSILPPGNGNFYGPTLPHLDDQRARYDGITDELAAGTLNDSTLGRWFKKADLGVPLADLERMEVVSADSKIAWDRFGTPHVVGKTDYAGSYAFGWAVAEARLPIMELLRLIGRSGFLETGGESAITNFDLAGIVNQTQALNYSDKELNSGFDALYAAGTPAEAATMRSAVNGYLKGINAYYAAHSFDLYLIAGELGFPVGRPWTQADLGAVAIAIRDLFGDGGGGEVGTANLLTKLRAKFGAANAELIFNDLQGSSPTTTYHTDNSFPYPLFADPDPSTGDTDGASLGGPNAIPDPGSITAAGSASSSIIPAGLLAQVPHMSNYVILGGSRTKSGNPIQVGGPQTGYFSPEILLEAELHTPSIRARGIAVPGQGPILIGGRTADYAWTPTSGGSDTTDQRVELLCEPDGSAPTLQSRAVRFKGQCVPLTKPDSDPKTLFRSPHGPVFAFATVGGRPVAIAKQRLARLLTPVSALSFFRLMTNQVQDANDFAREMRFVNLSLNVGYINKSQIAYAHTGWYPLRTRGVDHRLPTWGTGSWEWRGRLDWSQQPHEVAPASGCLTSWNNLPAPDWMGESTIGGGPIHRNDLLNRPGCRTTSASVSDVVKVAQTAATQDLRGVYIWPEVRQLLEGHAAPSADAQLGAEMLAAWEERGSHRRDLNYDRLTDDPGVTVMDEFYPRLARAVMEPVFGSDLYGALRLGGHNAPGLTGSAFQSGGYGQLRLELQRSNGEVPRASGVPAYCEGGDADACAELVWSVLGESVAAVRDAQPEPLKARPQLWRKSAVGERIRFLPFITDPLSMRWQNRPTYQQVVTFGKP